MQCDERDSDADPDVVLLFVPTDGAFVEQLSQRDYANLLRFRSALRRFENWSQEQARQAGLTPAWHQLLLAIKGHADERGPTIRQAAGYLNTRHHSVVGLVDRAERSGLLRRARDPDDARVVRLRLTQRGEDKIAQLSQLHLAELARLAPILRHLTVDPVEPVKLEPEVWEGLGAPSETG